MNDAQSDQSTPHRGGRQRRYGIQCGIKCLLFCFCRRCYLVVLWFLGWRVVSTRARVACFVVVVGLFLSVHVYFVHSIITLCFQ